MTSIEDPHTVLHLYEGDGGVIIRENGNVSTFGAQSAAVLAAFEATSDQPLDTGDLLATIAGLRQQLERVTQERDDAERGRENAIEGSVERLKRAEEAEAQLAVAKAQLTRATDPEYLAEKLHQIGAVDAEWQARAERAEADNARLRSALEESDWRSPHETPGFCGATAIRVLVRVELIDNPPALNAPPRIGFGHRIVRDKPSDIWPKDGWFFDGQDDGYRVTAWRYIDPPASAQALLGDKP